VLLIVNDAYVCNRGSAELGISEEGKAPPKRQVSVALCKNCSRVSSGMFNTAIFNEDVPFREFTEEFARDKRKISASRISWAICANFFKSRLTVRNGSAWRYGGGIRSKQDAAIPKGLRLPPTLGGMSDSVVPLVDKSDSVLVWGSGTTLNDSIVGISLALERSVPILELGGKSTERIMGVCIPPFDSMMFMPSLFQNSTYSSLKDKPLH